MCMFSALVSSVSNTNIFTRSSTGGQQFLVYSMQFQANSDLAMILPLPTPPSPPEDAVRFIDLSGYPQFFNDMVTGCVEMTRRPASAFGSQSILKVQEVGSFQASFVPSQRDFARLDRRFRLPDQVWEQLPQYSDYAFAVFKLRAGANKIHPMAFEFPRRNPQELFFPTVHVHQGIVEANANFQHWLYFQAPRIRVDVPFSKAHDGSPKPARQFMDIGRTRGIVDADAAIHFQWLHGMGVNRDIVVEEET